MATFLKSIDIKSTRKSRRCFACGEVIDKGSKAVEWISVGDGSISSVYLHPECWEVTEYHCFGCNDCNDGDGFHERYLQESMSGRSECEGVKAWMELRKVVVV